MRTLLALIALISLTMPAMAADYASQISAYRRAHGLSAVKIDARLNAVALQQARAQGRLSRADEQFLRSLPAPGAAPADAPQPPTPAATKPVKQPPP